MTAGDEQDGAEALDTDKIDEERDDPVGQLSYPPEGLLGADDPTADDRTVDSVASRDERLEPDPIERVGDDAAPGRTAPGDDTTDEAVGRLTDPDAVDDAAFPVDTEAQAIAGRVPEEDLSAEEAAVHIEPE
jgi:hypothetical protein